MATQGENILSEKIRESVTENPNISENVNGVHVQPAAAGEDSATHFKSVQFGFKTDENFIETVILDEKTGELTASVYEVKAISASDRKTMWSLYSAHYDGATWQSFNEDMDEKTHIVVARDSGDASIQGFSTIKRFVHYVGDVKTITIYSGDTIIHPDYWGQKALHLAFFFFIARTRIAHPFTKVFWFLLCNGYRTYLTFARNIPQHWPHHERETPAFEQNVLESLATLRFGESFDANKGIVKFTNSLGLLKADVAPIGESELRDPAVRFLVQRNPGYVRGDELCCLGDITFGLMFFYPIKIVTKTVKKILGIKTNRRVMSGHLTHPLTSEISKSAEAKTL